MYHVLELPELSDDDHLLEQVRLAWVEGVAERFPELQHVLATLRETLVPRARVGYATRLWCHSDVPVGLLQDLAANLSRVYGTAALFQHVPPGELPGTPHLQVDDLGAYVFVGGVLDDELVTWLG